MIKYILAVLVLGVAAGYLNSVWGSLAVDGFVSDYLFNFSLVFLLFVMGLIFGFDKEAAAKLRKAGLKILVLPVVVAFGSVFGGLVAGLILGINVVASMAVCAGYGWYTLAGPLTGQVFGVEIGALGFAVNFFRELFTIASASVAVRFDKYASVALGGATTMDTTLPVITRFSGSDVLVASFTSGFALSAVAPFSIIAISSLK